MHNILTLKNIHSYISIYTLVYIYIYSEPSFDWLDELKAAEEALKISRALAVEQADAEEAAAAALLKAQQQQGQEGSEGGSKDGQTTVRRVVKKVVKKKKKVTKKSQSSEL